MRKGYLVTVVFSVFFVLFAALPGIASADIALEKPKASVGIDLMKALQLRKSTKSNNERLGPLALIYTNSQR